MSVIFTVGIIAVVAMWAMAVLRRLARLRDEVKMVWKKLESDQSNDAIKTVYNKHVAQYNDALESFPANILAPIAGFKPARRF